jgi:hypothetical protein
MCWKNIKYQIGYGSSLYQLVSKREKDEKSLKIGQLLPIVANFSHINIQFIYSNRDVCIAIALYMQ